jgi:hypothetical protein
MKDIQSRFVQELLSQSLQTNPNIIRLILPPAHDSKISGSVSSNLQKLTVLQEFVFEFHCTTDIVIELGKHCKLLKMLDVTSSVLVTDECVEHLLKLQRLTKLRVAGTRITDTGYALLLSSLPQIRNINWYGLADSILQNITKECLPLVDEFCGDVSDVSLLTKFCPRIRHLSISLNNENSCDLIQLTDVVWLQITHCYYNINYLGILIENMGTRLTKLDLTGVNNVNISRILSCSVLKILIIRYCEAIPSNNLNFTQELPHFKSVKELILLNNKGFKSFYKYLHHYVNLKTFHAERIEYVEDVSVSAILSAGGFKRLSTIILDFCGHLSLQTAMLLIEECDTLSVLGNLESWSHVSHDDKEELFQCVKKNNLALTVVL